MALGTPPMSWWLDTAIEFRDTDRVEGMSIVKERGEVVVWINITYPGFSRKLDNPDASHTTLVSFPQIPPSEHATKSITLPMKP